jgi:hypothetical protein
MNNQKPISIAVELKNNLTNELINKLIARIISSSINKLWNSKIRELTEREENMISFISNIIIKLSKGKIITNTEQIKKEKGVRNWNIDKYKTIKELLENIIDSELYHLANPQKIKKEVAQLPLTDKEVEIEIDATKDNLFHSKTKTPEAEVIPEESFQKYKEKFKNMLYENLENNEELFEFCVLLEQGKKYPDGIMKVMKIDNKDKMYKLMRNLTNRSKKICIQIKSEFNVNLIQKKVTK